MTALAWFSEVSHEVRELTSGYHLMLTYNRAFPIGSSPRSASFLGAQTENLRRTLADWRTTDSTDCKAYYPLEHKYSDSSLHEAQLKGRDVAVCQLLHRTVAAAGFSVFLASMVHHKEESPDNQWTVLDKIVTCNGDLIAREILVYPDEILSAHVLYHDDINGTDANSVDEPEYLSNEDSPAHFRYHDTVSPPPHPNAYCLAANFCGDVIGCRTLEELRFGFLARPRPRPPAYRFFDHQNRSGCRRFTW